MPLFAPKTETELSQIIANSTTPVLIQGGGTRTFIQPQKQHNADIVTTRGLSGITLYDPGAMVLRAYAGTPLSEINATLDKHNQCLAFEPPDYCALLRRTGVSTLGGVVATNSTGPRRLLAGGCRDSVIGVRFIDGQGQIIQSGGRVMKNVTGYDLSKLLTGSFGALGVLCEITLKVIPKAEKTAVLLIDGLHAADAVSLFCYVLRHPFTISGAAHTNRGIDNTPVTMIRLEGFAQSIKQRIDDLKHIVAHFGHKPIVETNPDNIARGWQWVRECTGLAKQNSTIWRIITRPTLATNIIDQLPENSNVLLDWGGELIWVGVDQSCDLSTHLSLTEGHAVLFRTTNTTHKPCAIKTNAPIVAELNQRLKATFDPKGIFMQQRPISHSPP